MVGFDEIDEEKLAVGINPRLMREWERQHNDT